MNENTYSWIILLYIRNKNNIVNQLYLQKIHISIKQINTVYNLMVKKNIAGLVFLNSKGLKLLFWAINLLPLLGSERVANINLSKRREFLPYSLNLIVIQRLYSRNDCLCILDILEEYTHPAPYLTWRLSLLDSRSITKYHMSVDSKDVKLLFKLETKVGACDEHYSHFLSPLFSLSPHTIASPPGDLRKKKTKSRKLANI